MQPELIEIEGRYWVAVMRYEHQFQETATAKTIEASDVAQGAKAKVRDGRVQEVYVPTAMLRDEDDARQLAQKVTQSIEDDQ